MGRGLRGLDDERRARFKDYSSQKKKKKELLFSLPSTLLTMRS
jgi:hypothetical protein